MSSSASNCIRLSSSRVLPFSHSATGNVPDQAVASFVKSIGLCYFIIAKSGLPGLQFDCVVGFGSRECCTVVSLPLCHTLHQHRILLDLSLHSSGWAPRISKTRCNLRFLKDVSFEERSPLSYCCPLTTWMCRHDFPLRCQEWSCAGSTDSATRMRRWSRCFANEHSIDPSEFQRDVTCIMVSQQANLSELHQLPDVLLGSCVFVRCSSVTLN